MKLMEEMRTALAHWEDSGLSLMAYARREGLSYPKLLYWRRKLHSDEGDSVSSVEFREVDVITACSRSAELATFQIHLPNGIAVDVASSFDELELRRLVSTLSSC